jgi:hypothetical protein
MNTCASGCAANQIASRWRLASRPLGSTPDQCTITRLDLIGVLRYPPMVSGKRWIGTVPADPVNRPVSNRCTACLPMVRWSASRPAASRLDGDRGGTLRANAARFSTRVCRAFWARVERIPIVRFPSFAGERAPYTSTMSRRCRAGVTTGHQRPAPDGRRHRLVGVR